MADEKITTLSIASVSGGVSYAPVAQGGGNARYPVADDWVPAGGLIIPMTSQFTLNLQGTTTGTLNDRGSGRGPVLLPVANGTLTGQMAADMAAVSGTALTLTACLKFLGPSGGQTPRAGIAFKNGTGAYGALLTQQAPSPTVSCIPLASIGDTAGGATAASIVDAAQGTVVWLRMSLSGGSVTAQVSHDGESFYNVAASFLLGAILAGPVTGVAAIVLPGGVSPSSPVALLSFAQTSP